MTLATTLENLDINQIKLKLKEREAHILSRLETISGNLKAEKSGISQEDVASDYESQAKDQAFQRIDTNNLKDIRAALKRIDDGEYGECIECCEEIAVERLKANEIVEMCITCQTKEEQLRKHYN
jgi:DnaK suppressor protein